MTETWLNEYNTDFVLLEGYDFCHDNRNTKQGIISFFLKSNINYTIIEQFTINIENCIKCITVKLLLKMQKIVICLYRKPNSKIADFTNCIECMFNSIKGLIWLSGDFNIDLLNCNVDNNTNYSVGLMYSMSISLINKPMLIPSQCHSIIDNIYSNSTNEDITNGVIISYISYI